MRLPQRRQPMRRRLRWRNPPGRRPRKTRHVYSLGVYLSHNLDSFQLSDAEFAQVRAGISDGFHHKADLTAAEAQLPKIQALQKARLTQMAAQEKQAGQAYLAKEATKPGAVKTTSGLLYIPVTVGTGPTRRAPIKSRSITRAGSSMAPYSIALPSMVGPRTAGGRNHSLLDRGTATDEGRRQDAAGMPRRTCLRRSRRMPKIKPGQSLVFDIDLLEIAPPPPAAAATPPGAGAGPAAAPTSAAPAASAPAGK